jgi:hypothetical protein
VLAVEAALRRHGAPIYARRQVIHNSAVVERLRADGVRFIEEVESVPPGAVVVFSAHGVAPAVRAQAASRDLRVVDATCPLVGKVHREVRTLVASGSEVLLLEQEAFRLGFGELTLALAEAELTDGDLTRDRSDRRRDPGSLHPGAGHDDPARTRQLMRTEGPAARVPTVRPARVTGHAHRVPGSRRDAVDHRRTPRWSADRTASPQLTATSPEISMNAAPARADDEQLDFLVIGAGRAWRPGSAARASASEDPVRQDAC